MARIEDETALEAEIREHIQCTKRDRRDGLSFLYYDTAVPIRELPVQIGLLDWMTWLDLEGTQITDLSPIAPLTRLEKLDLRGLPVTDLSPLAGMRGLRFLMLEATSVADLSVLSGLLELREVRLDAALVTDFTPLAACVALRGLSLRGTGFADLGLLAHLPDLEFLDITDTQVDDLSPILRFPRFLDDDGAAGIAFDGTPAVGRNKTLARICAEYTDPSRRASELVDHLTAGGLLTDWGGHA